MYAFTHAAHLSNAQLAALFDRVVAEGLYDSFFYAGQCRTAEDFVKYSRSPLNWVFQAKRNGELVAFAMLDNFSGESAYFHHCHFRAGWRFTDETAAAALGWIKRSIPEISTLIGITPVGNKLAVRFAKRNGFKILGEVPRSLRNKDGEVIDAVLSVYTWEDKA